ncbi:glycerophosphodiester phosphodiesterase [Aliikangiella marina]|uniref:Glycerophosphodiester phosphodiesterase n=1 Tax=Aliikangiella marina TaxID=1712262 RepID=A0A545TCV1_9GAMM|nr:glycerophosphodiester phosphodiesterase family protein [Aliikangiella marina]TQV75021.1 glycerophosphodiester phosphodiesterase [Aliikangiella marina]
MKVIAHRGASGYEPENTLLAIEAAIVMEVDAVEIDLHRVEDQLVVIHDRWIDKTTDGKGRLKDLTFAELRRFDAGKGQKVPTLWEVLKLINGRCAVNIELKADDTLALLVSTLTQACAELNFDSTQFVISSFNHHLLKNLKQHAGEWRIGALTGSRPLDYAEFAERLGAYSVHIDVDIVDKYFVDDAHARGLKVYVYTVDKEEDIDDLIALNVDGIFTNYPTRSLVKIAHSKL